MEARWWHGDPKERYWTEITDRPGLGENLYCPQANEDGKPYWSYSLIREVEPGDIVFHYRTRAGVRAFVGASVAGGPLAERPIRWAPHGTVGRSRDDVRGDRPGWWLPLYGYRQAKSPLGLADLENREDDAWIRAWITSRQESGLVAAPFQMYPGRLRASQGYLTKMPADFVDRWRKLRELAEDLDGVSEGLVPVGDVLRENRIRHDLGGGGFNPKSSTDYVAFVRGGSQRRSRNHEALVRNTGEWLQGRGVHVTTPHPIDLRAEAPVRVIFEAKVTKNRSPLFAIREAVGQLFEYRFFLAQPSTACCVLLDSNPGEPLCRYVESLGLLVAWWDIAGERLVASQASAGLLGNNFFD